MLPQGHSREDAAKIPERPCVVYWPGRDREIDFEFSFAWFALAFPEIGRQYKRIQYLILPYLKSEVPTFPAKSPPVDFGDRTDSESSWSLVKSWLAHCQKSHSSCNSHRDYSWTPTRLVDVQALENPQRVRLYLTPASERTGPVEYTTLSHCWGIENSLHLKLTKHNIDALCEGIDLSELPQTFKDAVEITRSLGIRYLWIDSLCIIQDANTDWAYESGIMDRVYMNGLLNISAAHATNSSQGCFIDRDASMLEPFSTTGPRPTSYEGPLKAVRSDIWLEGVERAPLNRRAWVLQERVLSRRILHYGKAQIYWECRELRACESLPDGVDPTLCRDESQLRSSLKDLVPGQSLADYVYNEKREMLEMGYWMSVVENYTKCDLTFQTDKLVALAGVARQVQMLLPSEYFAGIWKSHLPWGLLWKVNGSRAHEYIAPSWSWASVKGRITYALRPTHASWRFMRDLLTIIKTEISLASESNLFGQITGGFLRVRGKMCAVCWVKVPFMERKTHGPASYVCTISITQSQRSLASFEVTDITRNGSWCPSIDLDNAADSLDVLQQSFFLPVSLYLHLWGLLLVQLPCGKFVRIGVMCIASNTETETSFESLAEAEYTII